MSNWIENPNGEPGSFVHATLRYLTRTVSGVIHLLGQGPGGTQEVLNMQDFLDPALGNPPPAFITAVAAAVAAIIAPAGSSRAHLSTQGAAAAGWGSVDTHRARFTGQTSVGTDLTIVQNAASGDSISVNTNGLYFISGALFTDSTTVAGIQIGDAMPDADAGGSAVPPAGSLLALSHASVATVFSGGVISGVFPIDAGASISIMGRGAGAPSIMLANAFLQIVRLA